MFTRTIRFLGASIVIATSGACARPDMIAPDQSALTATSTDLRTRMLLVSSVSSPVWASDPLSINSASIEGDTLRIAATYGGGCRRHALQPIAETVWMESYPVQVSTRIAHNAGGDGCKALVSRVLLIDLSPLKELYRQSYHTSAGKIALRLAGSDIVPVYSF